MRAWLAGVKQPEHQKLLKRVDALIGKTLPGVVRAIKWRKPSNPLGVPFYGLPGQGWLMALWSFKDLAAIGFIPGSLLDPKPESTKMAGTWNRGPVKARRYDVPTGEALDEKQLVAWLKQLKKLPGFGSVE
ncbi:MAG: DUF1801 domain-containing protein [Archangium sp.]